MSDMTTDERPSIVLLHAFPLDHRMWSAQADALRAGGWNVHTPNIPGFGGTPLPEGPPDLTATARQLIDELPAGPVVIGGLSLGGYCTMAMLRIGVPNLVGVMLCDTKATADPEAGVANRIAMAERLESGAEPPGQVLRSALLTPLVGDTTRGQRPQVVEQIGGWLDEADPRSAAWTMRAMAARPSSLDVLESLDVPVMVLWGDEDVMCPQPEQDAMLDVLRDGREARIPGAGHLASVETPDAVTEAILGFVRSL